MISVIIPAYNRAQYICDAIDSVLAQTYKDYEIIVVDDGSTDNTKELLAKYNGKIQYVYQENGGISSARNTGIRLSKGEYLAFLDSDDAWLAEKLEKQMEAIKEDGVGFVYTAKYMMDENGNLTGDIRPHYPAKNVYDLFNEYNICMSVLVKKDLVIKAGVFDEKLIHGAEDRDLWIRIANITKIEFIDEPLVKYRIHSNNVSADFEKMHTGHIQMLKKFLKDKNTGISYKLKCKLLSKKYYLLGREQYLKGKYSDALQSILYAFKYDVLLFRNFIRKEDNFILKIKKALNPYLALLVYAVKTVIK